MVATPVLLEFQAIDVVMSPKEPSEYVAVLCTVAAHRRPASGFADLLNGQGYLVAGDRADGANRRRSDDRSSYLHARGHPTAAAETGADRSYARVRRLPGYGVCNILASRSISVGVELQG